MDSVFIEKGRPLFKGINPRTEGNVNRTYRSRLFWLSKNSVAASRYGNVAMYKPKRRLRLLKLTYRTIGKLINSPNTSENLRNLLLVTWGPPGAGYLNQLKYIFARKNYPLTEAICSMYWRERQVVNENTGMLMTKAINKVPSIWHGKKAGRLSCLEYNVKTYNLIRNKFSDKYDGLWSPAMRSPYHGKFAAELVIFKPSEVLDRFEYPREMLNLNLHAMELKQRNNKTKRSEREWRPWIERFKPIEGAGTRLYANPRRVNSNNTIAAKQNERQLRGINTRLAGPGKSFFKNNNSVLNANALRRLFNVKNNGLQ